MLDESRSAGIDAALRYLSTCQVGIVFGGHAAEYGVSCSSLSRVGAELEQLGVAWRPIDVGCLVRRPVKSVANISCVINVAYGRVAEGGSVAGLLHHLGVPFIGSEAGASAIALNKRATSIICQSRGLRVPREVVVHHASVVRAVTCWDEWPAIVKPVDAGSSLGVAVVEDRSAALPVLDSCIDEYGSALLQKWVAGTDATVGVVEVNGRTVALPVMTFGSVDLAVKSEKYAAIGSALRARGGRETEELQALAVAAHTAIGCRDFSRADFRIDSAGRKFLIDLNHSPGLGWNSFLPVMLEWGGFTVGELLVLALSRCLREMQAPRVALAEPRVPDKVVLVGTDSDMRPMGAASAAALAGAQAGWEVCSLAQLGGAEPMRRRPSVVEVTFGAAYEGAETRGLCEVIAAKRSGPSIVASALTVDKASMKALFHVLAIPTPEAALADQVDQVRGLRWPRVVKPRVGAQSYQVQLVRNVDELVAALADVPPNQFIIEVAILGTEFTTPVMVCGGRCHRLLPTLRFKPLEILDGASKTHVADMVDSVESRLSRLAHLELWAPKLICALDGPSLFRMDWREDSDGAPQLLEVDLFPNFAPGSLVALSAGYVGADITGHLVKNLRPTTRL